MTPDPPAPRPEDLGALVAQLASSDDLQPALDRLAAAARLVAGADLAYLEVPGPAGAPPRLVAHAEAERAPGAPAPAGVERALSLPVPIDGAREGRLVVAWRGRESDRAPDRAALAPLVALAGLALRQAALAEVLVPGRPAPDARALLGAAVRLRRIVDAAHDAILTADARGVITSINPAGEALFGHPPGALVGQPLAAVLPALADGGTPAAGAPGRTELEGARRDGSRFPAELSAGAAAGDADAPVVLIVRDVTERKAAERTKDEFVATVSHELRTPLTALRGHIELVLDGDAGPVTDLQRRFLEIASQSAERLGALINDLLDVARLEAGKVPLRRDLVDLAAVLREVAATFRVEATRRGLEFREDVPALPPVIGDRGRLVQVFGNLVSNAIKYTVAGAVGIEARPAYGAVEVVVHDTGIGMTEAEQQQLFTRFFRSRDRMAQDPGGTGLGLVIAKGLVEGHGGTITVESAPGAGTRVRVQLPAGGQGSREEPARRGKGVQVLVVDDEVAVRDLFLEFLGLWGYRALAARDGAEALAVARRRLPDVIVLDVGMLPMSGLDVLRELKADPRTRHIPVLLHSVSDQPAEMLALGAADFLQKPVSPARFREAIARALEQAPPRVFVVDGDAARRERIHRALGEAGFRAAAVESAAAARAIPAVPPPVILLGPALADGPAGPLLVAWTADAAFGDAEVILIGPWEARVLPGGPGSRVEILQGQRASDAVERVRAVLARRHGEEEDDAHG